MPRTRRIEEFVEILQGFNPETLTSAAVLDICSDTDIDDASLSRYVHWHDSMYTRNLIYRNDLFEVMAVCWQKGQKTVLHTHNGQLGWMMVNRGVAEVTNFKWNRCNASEGQNQNGLDCLAGATELDLARESVEQCGRNGHVNTIDRVRTIHRVAVVGEEPVVSVHIYSRPIDVTKYAMIYAGAQKNLGPSGCALVIMRDDLVDKGPKDIPLMLQYRVHAKDGSRHNTPNTFAIYLMGQVFKWMLEQGGLPTFAKLNQAKADLLYGYLDSSKVFYATAEKGSRSRMNICFRCKGGEDQEKKFLVAAEAANLQNLKGHRSVGGMRASVYNAVTIESVKALIATMEKFEKAV